MVQRCCSKGTHIPHPTRVNLSSLLQDKRRTNSFMEADVIHLFSLMGLMFTPDDFELYCTALNFVAKVGRSCSCSADNPDPTLPPLMRPPITTMP